MRLGSPAEATTTIIEHGTVTVKVDEVDSNGDDPDDDVAGDVDEGAEATFMVMLSGLGLGGRDDRVRDRGRHRDRGRKTTRLPRPNAALVIEAGDMMGMITVQTLDDTLEEANETVTVTLLGSGPAGQRGAGQRTRRPRTIADDEDTLTGERGGAGKHVAEGSRGRFSRSI